MQAAYYTGHARGIHPWRKRAAIDGRAALQIACGGARPTSSPAKVHSLPPKMKLYVPVHALPTGLARIDR